MSWLGITIFLCPFSSSDAFQLAAIPRPATSLGSSKNAEGIGVGIDLGTTHSAIAILDPDSGLPTIVPIPGNGRTMPSVVTLEHDSVLVGREAIAREAEIGSYRNVKRILGRGMTAAQESIEVVPFLMAQETKPEKKNSKFNKKKKADTLNQQLKEAEENPALLMTPTVGGGPILPAEISAHVLRKLVRTAENATKQKVDRAVIGVPAYFHDAQREATLQAARMAGLEKVKLLREPEAAALAYGVGKQQLQKDGEIEDADDDELVLVFDLGGGTYDVSMLLVGGGLTEIITTSGNSQLGGSDFDAKVAKHLRKVLNGHGFVLKTRQDNTCSATDAIVRSAEMVRIYLSNNKKAKLALPLDGESWSHMPFASDVILPLDFELDNHQDFTMAGVSNGTHVLCELTRREMEKMCQDEFLALLRPIREVAIMAGALLPGDASPTMAVAAMEMEHEDDLRFEAFYKENSSDENSNDEEGSVDEKILAQLQDGLDEINMKELKKKQQKGRKMARDVTKSERKYRQQKRQLEDQFAVDTSDVKVRDGINGRPISRVVLVGGATRMPAIGRLLAALTGVVPQKTVNPDEAVALGCAVQVGVLDGKEDLGTVLNPMQAAILRAVAEQQQKERLLSDDFDDDNEEEFEEVEFF